MSANEEERTYPTPIGPVRVCSNWPAVHHVFRRRCGWPEPGPKAAVVEVKRLPMGEPPPELPDALAVMDAKAVAGPDKITLFVPDPCFCAGVVLSWLWLALGAYCKPAGWELLHAAAVTDGEGVTLVFAPSGGGKTTALLAFLDAGAQFLSDDAVLLDTSDGTVRPWSSDVHLQPEQLAERWPELVGDTLDAHGKVRVSPQALGYPVSAGGKLRQSVVLGGAGEPVTAAHRGVGIDIARPEWESVAALAPVAYWGFRPPDLAERVAALYSASCPNLAVLSPFSGKREHLARWLDSFRRLGLPPMAHVLWLDNSRDPAFGAELRAAAEAMRLDYPNLQCWDDPHRVGVKDRQVAYLYQQLRTRVPEGVELVFCLEDDVLPDEGAFDAMLREWARRERRAIVGVPVAHIYQQGAVTALAWEYSEGPHGVQIGPNLAVREAEPRARPARVGGISFSCTLIPRDVFDACSLAPGNDNYPAAGFDHQFCQEAGKAGCPSVALWGTEATHIKPERAPPEVRLRKRGVFVVGDGEDVPGGATWEVLGRAAGAEADLRERIRASGADFVFLTDRNTRLSPAYVEASLDFLTWNPSYGAVWGYRTGADGRMGLGAGPGACVRLAASWAAPWGNLGELRLWLAAEGWAEGHQDRAPYFAQRNGAPPYTPARDPRRAASPYRVLMLNRDPLAGPHPGFGGDLTQIANYRRGLRALGVYADLRSPSFAELAGYDLVHLHHVQFDWAKEAADKDFGRRPVLCSTITHLPPGKELPTWYIDPVVSKAQHLLCYSRTEAAWYAERFPEKRIHVVPMGVPAELFPQRDAPEPAERTVFMAGKVCKYKNQLAVLEACRRLGVSVAFAGFNEDPRHDPYTDRFAAAVERYPRARMLGFLRGEELWDAYRSCHVHVNASEFEPFGQVTLEALALGANIVHSRHSWAAELFEKAGSLCEPGDVASIAEAIRTELARARGWAQVRPPSTIEAARALASVYEEALRGC